MKILREYSLPSFKFFFFLIMGLALISMNYVYIEKSLWNYVPFKNIFWTITVLFVFVLYSARCKLYTTIHFFFSLLVQIVFTIIDLYQITNFLFYLKSIPIYLWLIYCPLWPVIIIVFNEIIKVFEVK